MQKTFFKSESERLSILLHIQHNNVIAQIIQYYNAMGNCLGTKGLPRVKQQPYV